MRKLRAHSRFLGFFNHFGRMNNVLYREKSSIVYPVLELEGALTNSNLNIVKNFRESRNKLHSVMEEFMEEGKQKIKEHDYMASLKCFDSIIAIASGEDVEDLTLREKKLISKAYALKGEILAHGDSKELKLAQAHLEKALELNPNEQLAIECVKSLRAEFSIPITFEDERDNNESDNIVQKQV